MKPIGVSGSDKARQTTQEISNKSGTNKAGSFDGKKVINTDPVNITPAPQQTMASSAPHQHSVVKSAQAENITPIAMPPQAETPQSNRAAAATLPPASQDLSFQAPGTRSLIMETLPEAYNRPPEPQGRPPIPETAQANVAPGSTPRSFSDWEALIREKKGGTFSELTEFAKAGIIAGREGNAGAKIAAEAVVKVLIQITDPDATPTIPIDLDNLVKSAQAETPQANVAPGSTPRSFSDWEALIREKRGGTIEDLKEFVKAGLKAGQEGNGRAEIVAKAVLKVLKAVARQDPKSTITLDLDKVIEDHRRPLSDLRKSLLDKGGTYGKVRELKKHCKQFGLDWEANALDGMFQYLDRGGPDEDGIVDKEHIKQILSCYIRT